MGWQKILYWIIGLLLAVFVVGYAFGISPFDMSAYIAAVIIGTIQAILDQFGIVT